MSKDQRRYGVKPPEDRTEGERLQLRLRSALLIAVFLMILLSFVGVLYNTQIVNGSTYRQQASYTTRESETVDSVRGDILDSRGRVLVTNTSAYEVTLDTTVMGKEKNDILAALITLCREEDVEWSDSLPITSEAPYTFTKDDVYTYESTVAGDDGESTIEKRRTNLGALAVSRKWIADPLSEKRGDGDVTYLSPVELMRAMCGTFGIDLPESGEISTDTRALLGVLYELALRSSEILYTDYIFAENVDITFISRVKEQGLSGVEIKSVAARQINTTYAAHVLGRTGKYTSNEMWKKYKELGYSYDASVGLSGAELAFESYLHGTSGVRRITTSDSGKIVTEEWAVDEETGETQAPRPGGNVTLTLDIGLQAVVEDALAEHIDSLEESGGAACAIVDMTGGVLALASYPTYDLANYSRDFNDLLADERKPLLNRATSGLYSPGSTFKLLTATAGLMEGIIDPKDTVTCTGVYSYEGWRDHHPQCWYWRAYHVGHGTENLSKAIKDSCNIYFYDVGRKVGITKLNEYADKFGLGRSTGIEIGDEEGYVAGPATSEALGQTWYEGNITSAAIGQENNQFTPLQIANYIATLVNGGDHYQVHLLKSVKSSDYSELLYEQESILLDKVDISDKALDAMKQGMYQVTQNAAIARYFNTLPVKAGAKTGTAQISATSQDTNGLLVVFAPYDDPQIAMCIVMEKGASGSSLASIAADILSYYFAEENAITSVQEENSLIR